MLLVLEVVAAVVALMVSIAAYGKWGEHRRGRAYVAYSVERGYEYMTAFAGEERPNEATRGLFKQDDNPTWGPAIRGTCNGVPFTAFECNWYRRWTSPHNDGIGAMRWTMDRTLPRFLMSSGRSLWTGDVLMRAYYDGAIIEFDDSPDFSRHYSVQGNDAAAGARPIHPRSSAGFGGPLALLRGRLREGTDLVAGRNASASSGS